MKKLLLSFVGILAAKAANAVPVCPVCVAAVGSGLVVSRELGVDDTISGLWIGALTLALAMWLATLLRNRNVTKSWPYVLVLVGMYAMTFAVYLLPEVVWWGNTLWGIDRLFMGIILGSVVFWTSVYWYAKIKKNNGGHALFPFQKVIQPVAALAVMTLIFWLITK